MEIFNTLSHIDRYVVRDLERNKNRSFSGMFKDYRMKVPLIGDYPVLANIARVSGQQGKKYTRDQIRQATKYSAEWKGSNYSQKTEWLDLLVEQNQLGLNEEVKEK